MIGLIITFVVLPGIWLTWEAYRAPVAVEGPQGLIILAPGRRLEDLLPVRAGGLSSLGFWGVG